MIVVDTNIIAYAYIEGPYTERALNFFRNTRDWCVPPIFQHEIANILASYGRFKGFSHKECHLILHDIFRFVETRRVASVDFDAVLDFSLNHNISVYDAEFIWMAHAHKALCLTENRELRKAFPKIAISLNDYERT